MSHDVEFFAAEVISVLRAADLELEVDNDTSFSKGAYFSWDDKNGKVTVGVKSEPNQIAALNIQAEGTPHWFALNIELGKGTFQSGDMIGFVLKGLAGASIQIDAFIRSSRQDGFSDTELKGAFLLGEKEGISKILHVVSAEDALSGEESFHTLVLKLPIEAVSLTVTDFYVFVLRQEQLSSALAG